MLGVPFSVFASNGATLGSDAFKTMEEICTENGFLSESYTVQTSDDYILDLYRIPGQASEQMPRNEPKPAVLFMHAQDGDMMEWVVNSADKANAFILSRAGYDVWMGNNRGCKYG